MGFAADSPDDPLTIVPPTLADHRVLVGPVDKDRREDLQLWGFLQTLAAHGVLRHPVSMRPGGDPPDRYVETDGAAHAVELTELTMPQMRARLARVRQAGRALAELLADAPAAYGHLLGREVSMQDATAEGALGPGADVRAVALEIANALTQERGYVGEGVDVSGGFPEVWPNSRGFYGEIAGFQVQVNQSSERPLGSSVPVLAASQAEFGLGEVRSLLWSRVAAKDDRRNRVLLVTTGLVDSAGYVCPMDQWLFRALADHGVGDAPTEPTHLDAVVVHHFLTNDLLVAYQRPEAVLPWRT